jgi:GNAT superfamily N-acetyltransferase
VSAVTEISARDRGGIAIRLASYDDRGAIAGLRRAWTEENAGSAIEDDDFESRFDEWLEREQHQRLTWLGVVDGEPVGMLNLLVFTRMPRPGQAPSQWGYLANFFLLPAHRNAGLGSRMLGACTAYADDHGFARIVLSPSQRSVPFYARGGFQPATALMVRHPD